MTAYLGNFTSNSVTITSGQTVSAAIDLLGQVLCQIQIPAAFTGTTLTFQSSHDDSTYQALYNSGNIALSITVAAGRNYNIAPPDFAGCRFLKLVSGSAEGADRAIRLITRQVA